MNDTPTVIGINRTQDGSISVIKGPSIVYSLQKERITRKKHHWGRLGDIKNLYAGRVPYLDEPVDLVVECYSSDSEINKQEAYHQELKEVLTFCDGPQIACHLFPWLDVSLMEELPSTSTKLVRGDETEESRKSPLFIQ